MIEGSGAARFSEDQRRFMQRAIALARKGWGYTSPNPAVGALLVKNGAILGEGWHQRAGDAHAEVNAIRAALKQKQSTRGSSLYVTLEPCSTHGRTPPCTEAIFKAGVREVIVGAVDPNPRHAGAGLKHLRDRGIEVRQGLLAEECERLNEGFNRWIAHGMPWVVMKSAMTLDGKIATRAGESKWITSERSRRFSMTLRRGSDAILAGINTIVADDPALTLRPLGKEKIPEWKRLRRIVLDPQARIPLNARVVSDEWRNLTTIVVSALASTERVQKLRERVNVWVSPGNDPKLRLKWLLKELGTEQVTSLLIEGGGETCSAFLREDLVDRVILFYAPLILGGREARKAMGGAGFADEGWSPKLAAVGWSQLGPDLVMSARVQGRVSFD